MMGEDRTEFDLLLAGGLGVPETDPGLQVDLPDPDAPRAVRHEALRVIARRLGFMLLVLFILSIGIFALMYLAPGSPETAITAGRPVTPETLAAIRERYHLDDPIVVQYWSWLTHAVRLDFGDSFRSAQSVTSLIVDKGALTLQLAIYAFAIVLVVAIPMAMVAAVRRRTAVDRGISAIAVVGVATPPFVIAVLLLYVFGVQLGWFPIFGAGEGAADRIYHLTLPAIALASGMIALVLKITRASLVTVFDQEYITFARARGLRRRKVLITYGLRNGLGPVATAAGLTLASLIASTALVEKSFAIPGIGSLLVDAVNERDLPVIQGVSLTLAALVLLVTFFTDLAYYFLDPRIDLADSLS